MAYIQKLTVFILLALGFTTIQAQKVINIQSKLVGNNMEISYEITGADFNQKFNVSLYVSTDGGKTYQGPMTLIADGKKELVGGPNTLVWDIFNDITALDKELFFDVRAVVIESKIERHFFVQYSAGALVSSIDYITPIGFRLGMVGKTGWYLAGYLNTFESATYNYDGETMQEPILYEFTGKTLYPRMVVTAGLTFQLGWQSYLYAGAGYATKNYYTQINELNIDGTTKQSEQWVNMTEQEETGFEIEAGTILNFGKFSMSLGLSTFNFKQIGANAGIGIAF